VASKAHILVWDERVVAQEARRFAAILCFILFFSGFVMYGYEFCRLFAGNRQPGFEVAAFYSGLWCARGISSTWSARRF
jgi:hypothetical protein